LLGRTVPTSVLVVVDPGKVSSRVWLTRGERGLIGEPVSLPVLREGVDGLAGWAANRVPPHISTRWTNALRLVIGRSSGSNPPRFAR
jgi:hypothetical protein